MEKIQAALDRARLERGGPALIGALKTPRHAPLSIAYTRTKVVPVPARVLARERLVAVRETAPAAQAFKMLRTRLLHRLDAAGINSFAVTSPRGHEGKSLVAANLAIALAKTVTRTVLLVDADLQRPSVHRSFGLEPEHGLSDCITGEAEVGDCLINPGIARLTLLPQPRPVETAAELLGSPAMAGLAAELRERYPDRIVVYDCAPLLETDDPLEVLRFVGGCLLVVRDERTARADLGRVAALIGEERYLGTVLNDSRSVPTSAYHKKGG